MSSSPIAPNQALDRLRQDGYNVEIRDQHLLVHGVPFVTAQRVVRFGTLVCLYLQQGDQVTAPNGNGDNHQMWWTGEYPCYPDGTVLDLGSDPATRELLPSLTIRNRFSSKPDQYHATGYPDHYEKVVYYVRMIQNPAKTIDADVDARNGVITETQLTESVFRYPDTASARASILAVSAKLAVERVAIVGLGGTGAYVLDQIAKTPVGEIHLFDGDVFKSHNAFRSPGAASLDEVNAKEPKTDYYTRKFDPMRRGIISHPVFLDERNIRELSGFTFVFVCVDKDDVRALIARFLIEQGIPFVDTGMNLELVAATNSLLGTARATLVTPGRPETASECLPMGKDDDDVLYRQNIQVADMNAINAALAVIKWKQHLGFYCDTFNSYELSFAVNFGTISRKPCAQDPDD
jgi:molybdopterin/thiamine biosynthesis adenylyltransferase